jgi:hypothetical protein
VPHTIVPDNLKAAVIHAAFGVSDATCALNRSYRELAQHYGFKVDPAPPAAPKKKGKVESAVKYVKNNALKGRYGESIIDVNGYLDQWVVEIAGKRCHGTTGKKPLEVFEAEERAALLALPVRAYEPVTWKKATVHQDSHVVFDRRMYSVPWRHRPPACRGPQSRARSHCRRPEPTWRAASAYGVTEGTNGTPDQGRTRQSSGRGRNGSLGRNQGLSTAPRVGKVPSSARIIRC